MNEWRTYRRLLWAVIIGMGLLVLWRAGNALL